jgi:hypothetical protein
MENKICSYWWKLGNSNNNVMRKSSEVFMVYAKWNGIEHIKKYKHNPNYLSSVEFDTKN